jgi:transcriptional regulator with XRE-family HTH domain
MQSVSACLLSVVSQNTHGRVAFLPFRAVTCKSVMAQVFGSEPETLGEHIRKKRLQLALSRNDAGRLLGVTAITIRSWECGHTQPTLQCSAGIRQFLGYDPNVRPPQSLSEKIRAKRQELGWTQKHAACTLGVDRCTRSNWKCGGTIISKAHRRLMANFVAVPRRKYRPADAKTLE